MLLRDGTFKAPMIVGAAYLIFWNCICVRIVLPDVDDEALVIVPEMTTFTPAI